MSIGNFLSTCFVLEHCRNCGMLVPETSCAASLCEPCWQLLSARMPRIDWCVPPLIPEGEQDSQRNQRWWEQLSTSACAFLCKPLDMVGTAFGAIKPAKIKRATEAIPVSSAAVYEGLTRQLIHQMKYKKDPLIAVDLASLMPPALFLLSELIDLERAWLVPVPLSQWRFFTRGFNQAALLASQLGALTGLPVKNALIRKHSNPQHDLKRDERFENLKGAFSIAPGFRPPQSVVLVDDIYTSGATLCEAASALRNAGVEEVAAVTVARALLARQTALAAMQADVLGPGLAPPLLIPEKPKLRHAELTKSKARSIGRSRLW